MPCNLLISSSSSGEAGKLNLLYSFHISLVRGDSASAHGFLQSTQVRKTLNMPQGKIIVLGVIKNLKPSTDHQGRACSIGDDLLKRRFDKD